MVKTLFLNNTYLPYLIPYNVGHPPCKLYLFLVPSLLRLYQNTTDPFVGQATRPTIGNTVPPPSTSENCFNLITDL